MLNGIDVSVHLSRLLRVSSTIINKPLIDTFEQIIGIDPGLRFMFGSVAMTEFDQDFENGVKINLFICLFIYYPINNPLLSKGH